MVRGRTDCKNPQFQTQLECPCLQNVLPLRGHWPDGIWELLWMRFACFLKAGYGYFPVCLCVGKKFFKYFWVSLLPLSQKISLSVAVGHRPVSRKGKRSLQAQ